MEENIDQEVSKPKLPKSLTTVTTFSKILAMIFFIALPFLGFYLGMKYKEGITVKTDSINSTTSKPSSKACTQEAKQCSDGSYVSRTGPNCEFSPCPTATDETASWKTYTNKKYSYSFKYPKEYTIREEDASTVFYVWLSKDKNDNFRLDIIPSNNSGSFASRLKPTRKFPYNDIIWTEYPKSSYSDAGMSGDTPITLETLKNGFYFSLILFKDDLITAEKIVSTFKFTK